MNPEHYSVRYLNGTTYPAKIEFEIDGVVDTFPDTVKVFDQTYKKYRWICDFVNQKCAIGYQVVQETENV